MPELGLHLVVDAWNAPPRLLDDPEYIRQALIEAVAVGEGTLIDLSVHQFSPQGVTAIANLAESHIAIHTWPEHGYFGADLFFCGSGEPKRALEYLVVALRAGQHRSRALRRGFGPPGESLQTVHDLESSPPTGEIPAVESWDSKSGKKSI